MELRDVRGYTLSSQIDPPQNRPFHGGTRRLLKRDAVLVTVETANGQCGAAPAGASSSAIHEYFQGKSQRNFADVIGETVADVLEGETIEEIRGVHELFRATNLPSKLRTEAISAIDVACHEVVGRRRGTPVYELLAEEYGAEPTTELPLYASARMYMEPEGYVRQARAIEDLSFSATRTGPGSDPEATGRRLNSSPRRSTGWRSCSTLIPSGSSANRTAGRRPGSDRAR